MSNRNAFLVMLKKSEGTEGIGDNGYDCLFGSTAAHPKLFPRVPNGSPDYRDHPRQDFTVPRLGITTSAAGAFQIEAHIFDYYRKTLSLADFGHTSQIAIAMEMIKECHAMPDIDAGNLAAAVAACAHLWASLSGAGYGQRENSMDTLTQYFTESGGVLSANGVTNDASNA